MWSLQDGGVALAERLERAAQAVKAVYSECPSYDVVSTTGPSMHVSHCCSSSYQGSLEPIIKLLPVGHCSHHDFAVP
jgi:hypothetical protein